MGLELEAKGAVKKTLKGLYFRKRQQPKHKTIRLNFSGMLSWPESVGTPSSLHQMVKTKKSLWHRHGIPHRPPLDLFALSKFKTLPAKFKHSFVCKASPKRALGIPAKEAVPPQFATNGDVIKKTFILLCSSHSYLGYAICMHVLPPFQKSRNARLGSPVSCRCLLDFIRRKLLSDPVTIDCDKAFLLL